MTLKTILVGVGNRGRWAVDICREDSRFQAVALVDTVPAFLRAAREDLHLPESVLFEDLQAALDFVEADAVIICTPTVTHVPFARLAFGAGKHVLTEKGMTLEWQEARALVSGAKAAGVKFCVAQNYRYFPAEWAITEILRDPAHLRNPGEVFIVDLVHHRYRPEPRTLNYPFAMIWDMGCHHIDLLNMWLGAARRVTAVSSNAPWSAYENDSNLTAVIEFESGACANYVITHSATFSGYHLLLQGQHGSLSAWAKNAPHVTFDGPLLFYPRPSAQLLSSEGSVCEVPARPRSEQGVMDAFYRYICDEVEPGISGRNNLKTLAICEMMVRSAREKRTVEAIELGLAGGEWK